MDGCCRILVDEIHRFEGTVGKFRGEGLSPESIPKPGILSV